MAAAADSYLHTRLLRTGQVWELEDRDDECWHAGRMIENFLTWCAGQIDELVPGFVGLAIQKLGSGTIKTDVLNIMSINIVLTALQYNPGLVITAMEAVPVAGDEPVLARFMALWFTSIQERKFTGVHNRKLGILTLCTLLELDFARLPPYIQQVIPHAIEMSLILFEKLPRAYDLRNLNEADSDDEDYEEEEIDDDADGLDDEADFNDPLGDDQLRAELRGMGVGALGEEEDEESDAELDIGQFQEFRTKLDADAVDEYQLFSALLEGNEAPPSAACPCMIHRARLIRRCPQFASSSSSSSFPSSFFSPAQF